jgi:hypothetical protein
MTTRTPAEQQRLDHLLDIADQIGFHRLCLALKLEPPDVQRERQAAISVLRLAYQREQDEPVKERT